MASGFKTVGVAGKHGDPRTAAALPALAAVVARCGATLKVEAALAGAWPAAGVGAGLALDALVASVDVLVVVGGDGTMLAAARAAAPRGVPLIGVNVGRLGFLADLRPDALDAQLAEVLGGRHRAEHRQLLDAELVRGVHAERIGLALNDVVVQKWDGGRMIEFDTHVDGTFVCAHRADGLVVATPTGSTAYALSSGGPILHPGLDALVLVPICPHTLSDRPVVVQGSSTIEVAVRDSHAAQAQVALDGQTTVHLAPGDRVRVSRAAARLTLLHPPGYDYFDILRTKLHWGRGTDHDIGR
jgi:NAD+ kinase